MKTLIICISIHNKNTSKIAKTMAEVLDARIVKPHEILPLHSVQGFGSLAQNDKKSKVEINALSEYDLIGFGSGIYFGKHHKSLFKLIDKLPNLKDKKVFIFSTSGMSNAGNFIHNIRHRVSHFHIPLKKKLLKKGFNIIGEFDCRGFEIVGPFKLIGGICKGRPNENDLENAKSFAKELKGSKNTR